MNALDKVVVKKDIKKIIYVIESITFDKAYIKGLNYRIMRIVYLDDIRIATDEEVKSENTKTDKYFFRLNNIKKRDSRKYILGRILHIDGDKLYLNKCLELYKTVGVFAYGVCIKEENMADEIEKLVMDLDPDVVVITGHDVYNNNGVKDLENYNNTNNFIKAVRKIRKLRSKYDCVIIAGACQSNFEALVAAGADFASSPKRINIHTFDPAVIAIKVASTSFTKVVNLDDALRFIENGKDAYGGVETLGKMKLLL